jgi:hypothetical protein
LEDGGEGTVYGTVCNTTFYYFHACWLYTDTARAVNHPVTLDGLRKQGWLRGRFVGVDGFFERHLDLSLATYEYTRMKEGV